MAGLFLLASQEHIQPTASNQAHGPCIALLTILIQDFNSHATRAFSTASFSFMWPSK